MVYREPYGRSIDLDALTKQWAQSIGRALGALHELDPQIYASAGVPIYDADGLRRRLQHLRHGHGPGEDAVDQADRHEARFVGALGQAEGVVEGQPQVEPAVPRPSPLR